MRIAIQNPQWICGTDSHGLHDYGVAFLRAYRPVIYLTRPDYRTPLKAFLTGKGLRIADFEIVYTVRGLNRCADALVCLNGRPDLRPHRPPRRFDGLKIYHVMDHMVDTGAIAQALSAGGVDWVMGYSSLDQFDGFFRQYYPAYTNRVINVPFGFHPRFEMRTPFRERQARCVAVGSVNPIRDPLLDPARITEYTDHFRDERWMHKFRRQLVERAETLTDVIDSTLPVFPETKNTGFDMVSKMNDYQMFVSCESVFFFPSAKTFEGPAAGAVMICSDHACNRALGFVDGDNCIMHRAFDVDHCRDQVARYIADPETLPRIHERGTEFVRTHYSHEEVARKLHNDITAVYEGHKPGAWVFHATEQKERKLCGSSPIAVSG